MIYCLLCIPLEPMPTILGGSAWAMPAAPLATNDANAGMAPLGAVEDVAVGALLLAVTLPVLNPGIEFGNWRIIEGMAAKGARGVIDNTCVIGSWEASGSRTPAEAATCCAADETCSTADAAAVTAPAANCSEFEAYASDCAAAIAGFADEIGDDDEESGVMFGPANPAPCLAYLDCCCGCCWAGGAVPDPADAGDDAI